MGCCLETNAAGRTFNKGISKKLKKAGRSFVLGFIIRIGYPAGPLLNLIILNRPVSGFYILEGVNAHRFFLS
jgi:hypothetical protein